jgi:hypothetical protein
MRAALDAPVLPADPIALDPEALVLRSMETTHCTE